MRLATLFAILLLTFPLALRASDLATDDPFQKYLDGKPPRIVRDVADDSDPLRDVDLRRLVFHLRDAAEVFAVVATPKTPGKHPGMLVLHGGGGSAEVDKAIAWAQRGYVAVAPDLPGIANPQTMIHTKGRWNSLKYGESRYTADPDVTASLLFVAVRSEMKSLALLREQPAVDTDRIGVVGISWGGYMTTMVCGLAGDQVRAGFSVYGCGFYEFTSQQPTLAKMPDDDRTRWLKYLDAGRRAPNIKAAFFIAGAADDFFFWPPGVQATLDAIPGQKNHLFSPNETHKVSLPGGTVFPKPPADRPVPLPFGSKANWLAMEVPYFEYYLNGVGKPLPKVMVEKSDDPRVARFAVEAPLSITKSAVWWTSSGEANWTKRKWLSVETNVVGENRLEASLPAEVTAGADWFAVVSDDRPVTVSSKLMHIDPLPK